MGTQRVVGTKKKAVKASAAVVTKSSSKKTSSTAKKAIVKSPPTKNLKSTTIAKTSGSSKAKVSKTAKKSSSASSSTLSKSKSKASTSASKSSTTKSKPNSSSKTKKKTQKNNSKTTSVNKSPAGMQKAKVVKIPSYRQLKQNLYRLPLSRPSFDINSDINLECNCCINDGGCNENCQNRLLFTECIPELCHCTQHIDGKIIYCQNTIIQRQAFPTCEVFPTSACGFGLRVLEDVPSHCILTEYMGEVITTEEYEERLHYYRADDDLYFALLGNQLMLDANKMGSIARFANHSCEPNCAMQKWNVKNELRIVLVSLRPLHANEEITYNYHFYNVEEIQKSSKRKYQTCHCGSAFCTGVVGGGNSQSNPLTEEKFIKLLQKGQSIMSSSSVFSKESVQQYLQQSQELLQSLPMTRLQNDKQIQGFQKCMQDIQSKYQLVLRWEEDVERRILAASGMWMTALRAQGVFVNPSIDEQNLQFISRKTVQEAIQTYPWSMIRSKVLQGLKQLLSQHLAVCQSIRQFLCTYGYDVSDCDEFIANIKLEKSMQASSQLPLDGGGEVVEAENQSASALPTNITITSTAAVAATQASSVKGAASNPKPSAYKWHDLQPLLKQIMDIFPLYIPSIELLLSHYLQMCTWAQQHLIRYIPTDFVDMKHREHQFLDKLYQACINSLQVEDEHGLAAVLKQLSTSDIAMIQHLPSDIMKAMSYLNTFLNVAITRDELKKTTAEEDHQEQLYCICQLPESDSLCAAFTLCTSCEQWYHLPCLNYPTVSIRKVNQQEHFYCHICQLTKQNQLSGFALVPNSEWKYFEAKERQSYEEQMKKRGIVSNRKVPAKSTSHPKASAEVVASQLVLSEDTARQIQQSESKEKTVAKAANKKQQQIDVSFVNWNLKDIDIHRKGGRSQGSLVLIKAVQDYWKSCQAKRTFKSFFTWEELLKLTSNAKLLPIKEMPAVDILDFMEKKANDWQLCVETFSSQHQDKLIAAIEESIISNEEDVLASPKSSTLTSMYQTMLHFYYDMYIYRIKNMAVLDLLRVWIWIVANIPLLHAIHMHEEASASAVQVPSKESATFSIEEMQEVLKASLWMQKHCPKGSIQQQYITKIQNFHDSLQTCLKQASECRNSVEAISVFPQLQAYKHFIGIDHALTYAKVLCFLRPAQIRLQLGDLKQQQISLSETFLQPEVSTNPTQEEDTLLEATVDHDVLAAVPSKESQSTLRPVMESTIQQSIDTLEQYLNQIINHDSADIFCWCRHEDDQHLMLGCDRCNDWFHATCVGISSKGSSKASASTASQSIANKKKRKFHKINTSKLEHESAEYLCLSCSSCLHREYPYAW